jgi:hypothetical protein
MKTLARCLVMFFMISLFNNTFADEWVAYRPNFVHVVEQPVNYVVPQYHSVVYYQPVPYVSYQNFIIEKQCLLFRTQRIVTQPVVQWYYQPMVLYR